MPTELGDWLREQRVDRHWSRADMARKLIEAAKASGDDTLPGVSSLAHNVFRWEKGQTGMHERYKLIYCRALDIRPAQFGPQPASHAQRAQDPAVAEVAALEVSCRDLVTYRGIEGPEFRHPMVKQEVLMAAHEGSDHAAHAEEHGIGEATLEQLRADLMRLSRQSDTGEPFAAFLDMRRVRERVYQLLERRLWPREQADLYFVLGVLNGLMGLAADRMGYPDSAEELLRSGWAYSMAIDNRALQAALRMRLSSVAYWRGMPVRSRDLAADGLRYATAGPTAADLHLKYAQAVAQLGDADGARQAVQAAHEARARDHHDELLEIGGEFALSEASHHYFAGAALFAIDGAETEAVTEIERAVSLYQSGPAPGEQFSFEARARASSDLAALRLRSGALDAASSALTPVLTLAPAQRVNSVLTRLRLVRTELTVPIYRNSPQARDLDEQIEEFTRDSVTTGLHSLPIGPN